MRPTLAVAAAVLALLQGGAFAQEISPDTPASIDPSTFSAFQKEMLAVPPTGETGDQAFAGLTMPTPESTTAPSPTESAGAATPDSSASATPAPDVPTADPSGGTTQGLAPPPATTPPAPTNASIAIATATTLPPESLLARNALRSPSTTNTPPQESLVATSGSGSGRASSAFRAAASSESSASQTADTAETSSSNGDGSLDPLLSYACVCKNVRKVSLMSASDYCLSPAAVIGNKCGNAAVAEKGECPLAGAQPCQDTGHVLSNDSICAFDKRDETYKCVASKEDLYIQKYGKKKKTRQSNATAPSAGGSSRAAPRLGSHSALRVVLLAAALAVGVAAVA